ncbi:hypothetical protein QZH41_006909 [Actinostola sp. cb2023]|nr:hypothetical protein QZH41_006909 [Actinostola sp. cb2023]
MAPHIQFSYIRETRSHEKHSGLCELNDISPSDDDNQVEPDSQATMAWWVTIHTAKYVFTSLGFQGQYGPTDAHGYNGSNLEGNVQVNNGFQTWTVPVSGNYVIEAFGAAGANGTCKDDNCTGWSLGGRGAKITATFTLKQGSQLRILVGQQGLTNLDTSYSPGGGGGGSFVALADDTPLVIAGGGGGGGVTLPGVNRDGDPGQATRNGSRYGGRDGEGGQRYDPLTKTVSPLIPSPANFGGCGAGLRTQGDSFGGHAARSFLNGGTGGSGDTKGGFGGGGFALAKSPGGGGGYCGGGVILHSDGGLAGGGGSWNSGSNPLNQGGYNREKADMETLKKKIDFSTLNDEESATLYSVLLRQKEFEDLTCQRRRIPFKPALG